MNVRPYFPWRSVVTVDVGLSTEGLRVYRVKGVGMCLPSDFTGMELRVANRYRLGRKIGNGSFGDIYLGK